MRTALQIALGSFWFLQPACGGQTTTDTPQEDTQGSKPRDESASDEAADDDDHFIIEVTPSTFDPNDQDYAKCMAQDSQPNLEAKIGSYYFLSISEGDLQAICNKCPTAAVRCIETSDCYGGDIFGLDTPTPHVHCGAMTQCVDDLFWGETTRGACGTTPSITCRNYLRDVHADTTPYDQVLTSELMTDICAHCEEEIVTCVEAGQGAGGAPGDCAEAEVCVNDSLGLSLDLPWKSKW